MGLSLGPPGGHRPTIAPHLPNRHPGREAGSQSHGSPRETAGLPKKVAAGADAGTSIYLRR
jgi:hypothetical protein